MSETTKSRSSLVSEGTLEDPPDIVDRGPSDPQYVRLLPSPLSDSKPELSSRRGPIMTVTDNDQIGRKIVSESPSFFMYQLAVDGEKHVALVDRTVTGY